VPDSRHNTYASWQQPRKGGTRVAQHGAELTQEAKRNAGKTNKREATALPKALRCSRRHKWQKPVYVADGRPATPSPSAIRETSLQDESWVRLYARRSRFEIGSNTRLQKEAIASSSPGGGNAISFSPASIQPCESAASSAGLLLPFRRSSAMYGIVRFATASAADKAFSGSLFFCLLSVSTPTNQSAKTIKYCEQYIRGCHCRRMLASHPLAAHPHLRPESAHAVITRFRKAWYLPLRLP
jgi:hypothetical protein